MGIRASRTARPTRDLAAVRGFYEHLVGLPVLFEFADHDGFDGVVFGLPDERAQLELVRAPDADVAPRPTVEDLQVLYFDDEGSRAEVLHRLADGGALPLAPDDPTVNPYWPATGALVVVDPDGYRLVLSLG
ncbi:VOC family protein [Aquihabitans sp. G128]|uniref:VOC family protein n=1 Tax=Aquihabitans sp. G128 TaxID=2849779 RepID=UPI001C22412D|nr:VOC family protein [Aquihabitans sp. G128]QXC61159.1 VOC family protein [Aquihabitans sp. G128]